MDSEHPEFTNPFEHGRRLPRHDASTRMEPQRSGYYPTQPLGRQQIQNVTDTMLYPCKLLIRRLRSTLHLSPKNLRISKWS